ncbi:hypothetical protein QMO56_15510 [Roseomonas sp. E05]|uniref:hypothetical protein n=1 Tax=Roseomonas sp. E05 TaxID=3046310 RepID=UPI0024B9322A|nr:hypothetical protein [Roseomonas sp. E05]MDJ0389524.1 hypothetical protein [Roseomonas sp. E05]
MAGQGDDSRHDPGDAVPEGVAPASPPPPPRAEDLKVKHKLEELGRKPGDAPPQGEEGR